MEFKEKLISLRKNNNMTQEELAEKIYVTRTAVSKWENGRGCPNLDSLKKISELFNISINDLLSSEEAIYLAEENNKEIVKNNSLYLFSILDIISFVIMFLPFFSKEIDGYYYSVSLFNSSNGTTFKVIYLIIFIIFGLLGIVEIIFGLIKKIKYSNLLFLVSTIYTVLSLSLFILSNEPYVGSFLLLFLISKIIFYFIKEKTNKK